jgi:uncharacterized protein YtpQ (UPF0354 family)
MARDYVRKVALVALRQETPVPLAASQLLPAVRSRKDVDLYRAKLPGIVVEPLVADLYVVMMVDTESAAYPIQGEGLEELSLSVEAAQAVAHDNLKQQLPLPAQIIPAPDGSTVGVLDLGHYYTSSLVISHPAWAEVAARFDGKLLVAVPSPQLLIFTHEIDETSAPMFKEASQALFERAERGLSPTVLRWTPTAWSEVEAHP